MRGKPDGLGGLADAVAEERVAGAVGRAPAEDARGPDRVELPELHAVGERAQVDVVDEHGAREAHAELVDDLLEGRHTTSPCRIVSSVTTRGSTNCNR